MVNVLGLSLYGPLAASHRVRLQQFQPGLAVAGINIQIQSLLDDSYLKRSFSGARPSLPALVSAYSERIHALLHLTRFDLAIVYGDLLPYLPGCLEGKLLKIPYIYDFDDAFYLKYRTSSLRFLQPFLGDKADRLISGAVAVTAGNRVLAAYARKFNSTVSILPSVVDTDYFSPVDPSFTEPSYQPFTVGWIGSPSTAPYLHLLVEPLRQLALEQAVRLLVVGASAPPIPGVEIVEQSWSQREEVDLIRRFDVGVMPLPDTPWTRGKCAFKLIQCMACGIPVIASPVGTNVDVLPPGCGFLADSSDSWLASLRFFAANPSVRHRYGASARYWVEQNYSLYTALPLLQSVIESADLSRTRS